MTFQESTYHALLLTFAGTGIASTLPQLNRHLESFNWHVQDEPPFHVGEFAGPEGELDKHVDNLIYYARNPADKVIVYYGGHAVQRQDRDDDAPDGWRWHEYPKVHTCRKCIISADPEPAFEQLAAIPNDILFIFHGPFELAYTSMQNNFGSNATRGRNVQVVQFPEDWSTPHQMGHPVCYWCNQANSIKGRQRDFQWQATLDAFNNLGRKIQPGGQITVQEWVDGLRSTSKWPVGMSKPEIHSILGDPRSFVLKKG